MRALELTRNEAEWLVDLLEDCDPKAVGSWRHDLAAEIRTLFGMVQLKDQPASSPDLSKVPFWIQTRCAAITYECVSDCIDGVARHECVTRFSDTGECWVTTGIEPRNKIRKITAQQFDAVREAFFRRAESHKP